MDEQSNKKLKILYIGGDINIISQFETSQKYEITKKENSLSAIRWLGENKNIDAILCEMYIPGMNGIEIFKFVMSKNLHLLTPFILINHVFEQKNKQEAFINKIDDYYITPLNPDNIFLRINFLKKYKEFSLKYLQTKTKSLEYRIPFPKRMFDIVLSGLALLFLLPFFFLIALAIKIESKGKIFYISKRVGTGYKVFNFYKFRSMFVGAEIKLAELKHLNQYNINEEDTNEFTVFEEKCEKCEKLGHPCSPILFIAGKEICEDYYLKHKKEKSSSTFIKIKDDPRVTKVGKFLRNTSLDELPQLINVLRGDMSIVGNRPLPLYEAELLTSDEWGERFLGPAGITGLWQVYKRGKSKMSEDERKMLDNRYAQNNSFWGDIKIILMTIPAIFQKENV